MPSELPPPPVVTPTLPPYEGMPPIQVSGTGHTLNFGGNAKTTSSVNQHFLSKQMATHGLGYWIIHFLIALAATALFEFGIWLYHH